MDSVFTEHYTKDNNKCFNILIARTVNRLGPWKEAFQQCVDAYNRNHFLITIPTLFVILESLLTPFLKNETRFSIIELSDNELAFIGDKDIWDSNWKSVQHLIKGMYKHGKFDENEPELLNRHWVLHGRSSANWTQTDSLKLFNAIGNVALYVIPHAIT